MTSRLDRIAAIMKEPATKAECLTEAFCELDDEKQADFFVNVERIARGWKPPSQGVEQAWHIGRHLRTCGCSTDDARYFVRRLADGVGE